MGDTLAVLSASSIVIKTVKTISREVNLRSSLLAETLKFDSYILPSPQ